MDNVNEFLEKYPKSSVERYFFENCFAIISQIKIDWGMLEILSFITLFDLRSIELHDGTLLNELDPPIGSITPVCMVLSVVFSDISDQVGWWRFEYFSSKWDGVARDKAEAKIIKYLLDHDIVKQVYMFLKDGRRVYSYELLRTLRE